MFVAQRFGMGESLSADANGWMRPTVCRKPLSFHTVSFGQEASSSTLRRMAELALEIQEDALRTHMLPTLPSSFSTALDTVSILTPSIKVSTFQMLMLSRFSLPGHSGTLRSH